MLGLGLEPGVQDVRHLRFHLAMAGRNYYNFL